MRNFKTSLIVLRRSAFQRSPRMLFTVLLAGVVLARADNLCEFSSGLPDGPVLDRCRPASARPEEKAAALASLPHKGEVTTLDESEQLKIAAVRRLLNYHDRAEAYVIKIIDIPQAFTGLHERTVLLFSRPTVKLLDAEQLQALAAHEVGHEYVWNDYRSAKASSDKARLRELEMVCDRIAVATLLQMRLPSSALMTALERVLNYNREHFGVAANESLYPSIEDRMDNIARMVNAVAGVGGREVRLTFFLEKFVLTLNIAFLPSFRGVRLAFKQRQDDGEQCFAANSEQTTNCPENFVGAVAIANYTVRSRNGHPARRFSLRERVTTIDQHPDLPKRGIFERTAPMAKGVITDLQVFGYDEATVPRAHKDHERETANKLWVVYRQELFANQDTTPFAIVEWKHTIRSITLLHAHAVRPAVMIQ